MPDIQATGKRKTAIARVRLRLGTGQIQCNGRGYEEYFPRDALQIMIRTPFDKTETLGRYDIEATLSGGGSTGQAGALRHGWMETLRPNSAWPAVWSASYLIRTCRAQNFTPAQISSAENGSSART